MTLAEHQARCRELERECDLLEAAHGRAELEAGGNRGADCALLAWAWASKALVWQMATDEWARAEVWAHLEPDGMTAVSVDPEARRAIELIDRGVRIVQESAERFAERSAQLAGIALKG